MKLSTRLELNLLFDLIESTKDAYFFDFEPDIAGALEEIETRVKNLEQILREIP